MRFTYVANQIIANLKVLYETYVGGEDWLRSPAIRAVKYKSLRCISSKHFLFVCCVCSPDPTAGKGTGRSQRSRRAAVRSSKQKHETLKAIPIPIAVSNPKGRHIITKISVFVFFVEV